MRPDDDSITGFQKLIQKLLTILGKQTALAPRWCNKNRTLLRISCSLLYRLSFNVIFFFNN